MKTDEMDDGKLTEVLGLMNEQSASLILMLLCDNNLDLHQLEVEADNEELESSLQAVRSVTQFPLREDIARVSRDFIGRFYSEGKIVSFIHPSLYDACAHALYTLNPAFLLQHCSLTFLKERVRHKTATTSSEKDHKHTVYVSQIHYDIIAIRLAETIEKGNYSMSLSQPVLQEKTIVDRLFHQLKSKNNSSAFSSKTDKGKYRLQWAVEAQSVYLVVQLLMSNYHLSEREIIKGFHTCVCCGSVHTLEHLLRRYYFLVSELHIKRAFRSAIDNHRIDVVTSLLHYGDYISDLSFGRKIKLFHLAGQQENIRLCQDVLNYTLSNYDIADCVRTVFENEPGTMLRTICNELLHIACNQGCLPLVQIVVAMSDINNRDQYGRTPIMNVAYTCRHDIFDFLLAKGADLTLADNYGDTALPRACFGGSISIVEQILPLFDINTRGYNRWTPLMNAGYAGKKEVFEFLLRNDADITATDISGDNVIHIACRGGNIAIVEILLEKTDISIQGYRDWTPVMTAAYNGKTEVFELLVTKGADLTLTDKHGDSALHLACHGGNPSIVEKLLLSWDVNTRGANGTTPVMLAAQHGQEEIYQVLVTRGADLTLTNNYGHTVLHSACQGKKLEIVKRVVSLFDINVKGCDDYTPLMKSIGEGGIDVFEFLLSYHPDVTLVDGDGDSLLHLACEVGDLDIVKCVMSFSDITLRNRSGWTPVMEALIHGQSEVFKHLLDEGADLTLVDSIGDDMLTLAYRGGCADIVRKLTPAGAEIMDIKKWSDMMIYLVHGHFEVLEDYKQGDPDLIQTDGFGDTLLHLACRSDNIQCVKHLLPCYDINVRGRFGWTPVMMAARCGNLDVFLCLVSHQADISLVSDTGEDVLTLARRGGNKDIEMFLTDLPGVSISELSIS